MLPFFFLKTILQGRFLKGPLLISRTWCTCRRSQCRSLVSPAKDSQLADDATDLCLKPWRATSNPSQLYWLKWTMIWLTGWMAIIQYSRCFCIGGEGGIFQSVASPIKSFSDGKSQEMAPRKDKTQVLGQWRVNATRDNSTELNALNLTDSVEGNFIHKHVSSCESKACNQPYLWNNHQLSKYLGQQLFYPSPGPLPLNTQKKGGGGRVET